MPLQAIDHYLFFLYKENHFPANFPLQQKVGKERFLKMETDWKTAALADVHVEQDYWSRVLERDSAWPSPIFHAPQVCIGRAILILMRHAGKATAGSMPTCILQHANCEAPEHVVRALGALTAAAWLAIHKIWMCGCTLFKFKSGCHEGFQGPFFLLSIDRPQPMKHVPTELRFLDSLCFTKVGKTSPQWSFQAWNLSIKTDIC